MGLIRYDTEDYARLVYKLPISQLSETGKKKLHELFYARGINPAHLQYHLMVKQGKNFGYFPIYFAII